MPLIDKGGPIWPWNSSAAADPHGDPRGNAAFRRATAKKQAFDAEVAKVFTGEDARKVLIIGPCSADREDSVLEYMNRLAKTAEEVKDKLIIIPRVYTNKPRTKGTGYKGLLHNPDPEAPR